MTERVPMLPGGTVYRIHWKLGTDLLIGVCHCGAEHEAEDPVELWDWLLVHPDGHRNGSATFAPSPPDREPISARV